MNYGKAIFQLLTTDTAVSNIVGQNIYPVRSADQTPFPYVVYQGIADEPQNIKEQPASADIATFQVDCFANTHSEAAELSEAVRSALDKQQGNIAGLEVAGISFQSTNMLFDEDQDVHHIALDFDLFINR